MVAGPNGCAARSRSPSSAPPATQARRRSGSTRTERSSGQVSPSGRPPGHRDAEPRLMAAAAHPDLQGSARGRSRPRQATSARLAQRAMTAGRRSTIAFQTCRGLVVAILVRQQDLPWKRPAGRCHVPVARVGTRPFDHQHAPSSVTPLGPASPVTGGRRPARPKTFVRADFAHSMLSSRGRPPAAAAAGLAGSPFSGLLVVAGAGRVRMYALDAGGQAATLQSSPSSKRSSGCCSAWDCSPAPPGRPRTGVAGLPLTFVSSASLPVETMPG